MGGLAGWGRVFGEALCSVVIGGAAPCDQGLSIQRVKNLYHMFKNCCKPVFIDHTFNNRWFLV